MQYTVAIADDDRSILAAADQVLEANGYEVLCFGSGEELLGYLSVGSPDIILLDVHMVGMNGFEVLKKVRLTKNGAETPVIFLAAEDDIDTQTRALSAGAVDFVTKPIIENILLMRVRNSIDLVKLRRDLKAEVLNRTEEVTKERDRNKRLMLQVVSAISSTIDAKDNYTRGHSARVAEYAREIAKRTGYSEQAQEDIYMLGLLHDVGKIGIPDSLINKPSHLTAEEFAIIKTHPVLGYNILKTITELSDLALGARWHHERFDGKGYPDGISGEEIPEEARIIAVADAYDAMSSYRSYHDIFAQQYIKRELQNGIGTQFDPKFALIMIQMIDEDENYEMREHMSDDPSVIAKDGRQKKEDPNVFAFLQILETCGLNTAIGMKYCMNDVGFYVETLREFISFAPERRRMLDKSFNSADLDKYRSQVHSLKNISRTIGAEQLFDMSAELEAACREQDKHLIVAEHETIMSMVETTLAGILMATSTFGIDL